MMRCKCRDEIEQDLTNTKKISLLKHWFQLYPYFPEFFSKSGKLLGKFQTVLDFSLVNVCMKECELIKGGHSFGFLAVKSTIPLSLSFKRSKDCSNLCSSSERALGPNVKSKTMTTKIFHWCNTYISAGLREQDSSELQKLSLSKRG